MNEREPSPPDRRGKLRRQLATNAYLGIDSDAHCHDPHVANPVGDAIDHNDSATSNAVKEQGAILDTAEYWGIDHGSLPRSEP